VIAGVDPDEKPRAAGSVVYILGHAFVRCIRCVFIHQELAVVTRNGIDRYAVIVESQTFPVVRVRQRDMGGIGDIIEDECGEGRGVGNCSVEEKTIAGEVPGCETDYWEGAEGSTGKVVDQCSVGQRSNMTTEGVGGNRGETKGPTDVVAAGCVRRVERYYVRPSDIETEGHIRRLIDVNSCRDILKG
jgi:hypothetical protein